MKSSRPVSAAWPAPDARIAGDGAAATATVPVAPSPPVVVAPTRRTGDVLGLAWVHGSFTAAGFRRQNIVGSWEAPAPVRTVEGFAAALDAALAALGFGGTEVFLVLAHDEFVHQTESAPSFSDKAAQAYLRGRVERLEEDGQPLLWVSQRAAAMKKEASYLLHLLPVAFYNQVNAALLARRLDLTRVLPLHVPLQLALSSLTETRNLPLLVAAEAGGATAVLVGRTGSEILFSRTILESWTGDAARVAVEINRSLLYAKQQFGAKVDFVWLLGRAATTAQPVVAAKCGAGTEIVVESLGPLDWLRAIAKLSQRHPVNLVGGFLRRKRRNRFARRLALAACWFGLAWCGVEVWSGEQAWRAEQARLAALQTGEPALSAEQERLEARNAAAEQHRAFVRAVADDRLPPVAERFLAYVAGILPREAQLSQLSVKCDDETGAWTFRLAGTLEADPETAPAMLGALRRQLVRSPLRVRFTETVRAPVTVAVGGATTGGSATHPFTLEGGLFEN